MSTKYFNFNNEADLTPIEVNDETGVVEFTLDGQVATFDSVQEFAEFYALARNVVPDNLKNWTLTEDGNHVAFVLRAGTAGLDYNEITTLVTGLHAAGMSLEEIGRVIASTQANKDKGKDGEKILRANSSNTVFIKSTDEELVNELIRLSGAVTPAASNSLHDQQVEEMTSLFNNLSELDRHVLLAYYEETEPSNVIGLLVDEFNEYDDEYFDDDDEYFDEDDEYFDEDDEYFDEDDGFTLLDLLHQKLNEAVSEATIEYSDIPKTLAKSLYANFYGDQDAAFEALRKANMTAYAASRQIQVYYYNKDFGRGEFVTYDYMTLKRLVELRLRTIQLVVENKKFYVIHNSNKY